MNIDVERLKHDADYWDEVGAPNGVTHFDPFLDNWINYDNGWLGIIHVSCSDGAWRTRAGSLMPSAIPRPTRKQWSGREDGLPPIGSKCTIEDNGRLQYGADHAGRPMEVVAHVEDCAVLRLDCGLGCFDLTALRPIKSEKERVVEAVAGALGIDCPLPYVLSQLYDLGALKMPEGE